MTEAVPHASHKKSHAAAFDLGVVVGGITVPSVADASVRRAQPTAGSLPNEFP
jgi:hypothetical protein